jgi:2-keto-4-pentenoate hydratase
VTFVQAHQDLCRQAAGRLLAAASDRAPCAPVRDLIGDGGMAAGYAVQQLLTPRIEAEVAFVLGEDLDQENLNLDIVRTAVDYAMPALEIMLLGYGGAPGELRSRPLRG